MSSTIPQNPELLKHFFHLLSDYRPLLKQKRTSQRVVHLVLGELFVFARHTVSQIIMALGHTDADWSAWYRVFNRRRFPYEAARDLLFRQVLDSYAPHDLLVDVPRSRAAPLSDPTSVVQRLSTVHHAEGTHFMRLSRADKAKPSQP